MALTPAERMKKYREKLKKDPQKYEQEKKKHAAKVKAKSKKITELSKDEQDKIRKKWREQKRRQAANKQQNAEEKTQSSTLLTDTKMKKTKSKVNRITQKYNRALKRITVLKTALETSKKKLYRQNVWHDKIISGLKEDMDKMKAREEVLESSLKAAYKKCKKNDERNILKDLTENEQTTVSKKKTYVSKLLGLKYVARRRIKQVKCNKTGQEIQDFFRRDDISRNTAGKRECRTLQKEKAQIRYLTDTMQNIYEIYRSEGGSVSFSTFYKYKPFNVLSPSVQNRDTCICIKHSNFEELFHKMRKMGVLPQCQKVEDIFTQITCDMKSQLCMHGQCEKCSPKMLDYQVQDNQKNETTHWMQWERIDHQYKKIENGNDKVVTTKKMAKVNKTGKVKELIKTFEDQLSGFKKHYYNWKHQQQQYRKCIDELQENEVIIICDFSENYCGKMAEEVQSMHFGAAKQQFTLHTGMIFWAGGSQSFCSISDNNSHEPAAIWAHLLPIIRLAKERNPLLKVIHFFSDGPSTQYRQKKNFYLHNFFTFKLGLQYSTWSFSESGHGKSVADGIGGAVKRALDKQVAYGQDVCNGKQAFDLLSKCMKSVKCIYIIDSDIDNIKRIVPATLTAITGTMQLHQVIAVFPNKIQHRLLSCFCNDKRGLCDCFNLRAHTLAEKLTYSDKRISITNDASASSSLVSTKDQGPKTTKESHETSSLVSTKDQGPNRTQESHETSSLVSTKDKGPNRTQKSHKTSSSIVSTKDLGSKTTKECHDTSTVVSTEDQGPKTTKESHRGIQNDFDTIEIFEDPIIIPFDDNEMTFDYNDIDIGSETIIDVEVHQLLTNTMDVTDLEPRTCKASEKKKTQKDKNNKMGTVAAEKRLQIEENCDILPKMLKVKVNKENVTNLQNAQKPRAKSIRNAVTRHLQCNVCKNKHPFQIMTQCMACKSFVCSYCNSSTILRDSYNDFICDICFGE